MLIEDLIKIMVEIRRDQKSLKLTEPTGQVLREGLRVSSQALSMPEEVALTPFASNMFKELDKRDRLLATDDVSEMERHIETETRRILEKYCGKETLDYKGLEPWSQANYDVDCWRNFKPGTEIRHVKPGMNEERKENFALFYKPLREVDIIYMLRTDPIFVKTVTWAFSQLPAVKSSKEWLKVNLPYMTKHTNVGYPDFRNDRKIYAPTGETYAKRNDRIARTLSPQEVAGYPSIAFGRNLRQKARPICGGSRRQALVYNQLEAMEIASYKEGCPLFIGYNSDEVVRSKMIILGHWLWKNRQYTCVNRDYHGFDTTVNPSLRRLVAAMSYLKAQDPKGKEIAFWRGVSQYATYLINGLTGKAEKLFGRIFSGELDTNRSGGIANAIMDIYAVIKQDPTWIDNVANPLIKLKTSPLWVMGDDNLLVQLRVLSDTEYSKLIKSVFGAEVSQEKGESGLFFLQRRLFARSEDNVWVYITPFTRVIRSLVTKEVSKGLGAAGWEIATYMNLYNLIEWPELMCDVARIFYKYDTYHLGLDWSVRQLMHQVAVEDKEAIASKTERSQKGKDREGLTADKLYDGDPNKSFWFKPNGELNTKPIAIVHSILSNGLKGRESKVS